MLRGPILCALVMRTLHAGDLRQCQQVNKPTPCQPITAHHHVVGGIAATGQQLHLLQSSHTCGEDPMDAQPA